MISRIDKVSKELVIQFVFEGSSRGIDGFKRCRVVITEVSTVNRVAFQYILMNEVFSRGVIEGMA